MKTFKNKNATKEEFLKEIFFLRKKINKLKNLEAKHIVDEKKIIRLNRIYSVLSKINEAIVRENNPRKLFRQACRIAVEDGSFKMAWIGLLNQRTLRVRPVTYWGDEDGYLDKICISIRDIPEGRGPTGTAIREGKCCIISDLEHDPRMAPWHTKAIKIGYLSTGAFPLRIGKDIIGAFTLHSAESDFFNVNEVHLLETLASDISFAVEANNYERQRKRIEKKFKISQEQLKKLSAHLQTVREEERSHIAHELHDEIGQLLTVLKINIFWLKTRFKGNQNSLLPKIDKMMELIDQVIQTTRRISTELRPVMLDHFGIEAAIEWQAKKFEEQTGIKCDIILPKNKVTLDSKRSITIFRIWQEALTNVYRHAKATNVKLILQDKKNKLILKIQDNGKGIEAKEISSPNTFGLLGIQERISFFDGEIKIKGLKGKGTSLMICMPKTEVRR
jgi:signal transduction histidine kinase